MPLRGGHKGSAEALGHALHRAQCAAGQMPQTVSPAAVTRLPILSPSTTKATYGRGKASGRSWIKSREVQQVPRGFWPTTLRCLNTQIPSRLSSIHLVESFPSWPQRAGPSQPLYAIVAGSRPKSKSGELKELKMPDFRVTACLVSHDDGRHCNRVSHRHFRGGCATLTIDVLLDALVGEDASPVDVDLISNRHIVSQH